MPIAETTADTDYNRIVAGNIRAELARADISQVKAAAALGVTEMWISRRLKGRTPLDANDIALFARYLGVPVSTFFETIDRPVRAGSADMRGNLYLVGPAGIEPTTSTVEEERLAPVTQLFGNVA